MLIQCFDPGILWDDYGIRSDVVGTFKDHIVTWVNEYLHIVHGEAQGNEIIDDIDRRISLVPSFPGLRHFPDGRDFTQWTGDDSKALMKVYITAIAGHVPSEMVKMLCGEEPAPPANTSNDEDDTDDHGAVRGPKVMAFVVLAATAERGYPRYLSDLAKHINQPKLPEHIRHFLYDQLNPDSANFGADMPLHECPFFDGHVSVYHSATAHFYAPSDLCGAGGMVIGWVFLFFSFTFRDVFYPCTLIHWFERVGRGPDSDTGLWVVKPEYERNGRPSLAVIHIDSIPRAAHLAGVYGSGLVPEDIHFSDSLDIFRTYFVNSYADHHMNEFLS
ncbi:hypothetical protein BJV74DRAFT_798277 [Russula compacta]|nr:hypothetical protein BJV74DRAFT_798277 [Russula compacta]